MYKLNVKMVERTFCDKVFDVLPEKYKRAYSLLSDDEKLNLNEIRLRAFMPCSFTVSGKNIPILNPDTARNIISTPREIEDIVLLMCEGSIYAYSEHIKNGYIPFMGTRVGFTGNACVENGEIKSFINFTSLNIRVPRFVKDASREFFDYISLNGVERSLGVLVVSPPGCGKTTFLRSLAAALSGEYMGAMRVCIADEREELYSDKLFSSCYCDVISGVPKATALEIAVRTMSPQVIVCDEIGSESEAQMLYKAYSGGIYLAASVHGNDLSDVFRKRYIKELVKAGAFKTAYFLERKNEKTFGTIVALESFSEC